MDKTNNLQHFLTDIADAIRETSGESGKINAQDFSNSIRTLTASQEIMEILSSVYQSDFNDDFNKDFSI